MSESDHEDQLEQLNSLLNNYDSKSKGKNKKKISIFKRTKEDEKSHETLDQQSTQLSLNLDEDDDSSNEPNSQQPAQQSISQSQQKLDQLTTSSDEEPRFRDTPPKMKTTNSESPSELSIELPPTLPNTNDFNYFGHQTKKMPGVKTQPIPQEKLSHQNSYQQSRHQIPPQHRHPQHHLPQQPIPQQPIPQQQPNPQHHQQPNPQHHQQPNPQHHQQPNPQQPIPQHSIPQLYPTPQPFQVVHKGSPPGNDYGIVPLTIATFNAWYSKKNQVSRAKRLVHQLTHGNKYLPDIICLQEVTPRTYQVLQHGLGQKYHLIDLFAEQQVPYCNVIGINKETMTMTGNAISYDFDSQMGRKLMVCPVKIRETNTKFHLLNAHLESLAENWKYRKNQLESIYRLIREEKFRNFILAGDFNIYYHNEPAESQIRLYDFLDAWTEMGSPQSIKFTYHYKQNPYAYENVSEKGKTIARFDRILYRFKDDLMTINKFKMIGVKEPHVSDHYGLLAEFVVKTNENE